MMPPYRDYGDGSDGSDRSDRADGGTRIDYSGHTGGDWWFALVILLVIASIVGVFLLKYFF